MMRYYWNFSPRRKVMIDVDLRDWGVGVTCFRADYGKMRELTLILLCVTVHVHLWNIR